MENKYNQDTVLLTRLSDPPQHLFCQTIPRLLVCSVLYNVLMETLHSKCKYRFAYAHSTTLICNGEKVRRHRDGIAKDCQVNQQSKEHPKSKQKEGGHKRKKEEKQQLKCMRSKKCYHMCTYKREIRKKRLQSLNHQDATSLVFLQDTLKGKYKLPALEVAVILNSTHNKNARFNFCFVFELKLFLKGIPSKTATRTILNNCVQTSKPSC